MTKTTHVMLAVMLLGTGFFGVIPVQAQSPGQNHIDHALKAFKATPEGVGLLQAAIKEAQIAQRHAEFAAKDLSNIDSMKRHLGHVLHALDTSAMSEGPGLGYGAQKATKGAIQHLGLAAKTDGASESLQAHAGHAIGFAESTLERIELIKGQIEKVNSSNSADEAAEHVKKVHALSVQLTDGTEDKPGLTAAEKHLGMIS